MKRVFGTPIHEYLPALGLLVITTLYLYLSAGYPPKARVFPAMVAWVMLGLLALDLMSRTQTALGRMVMRALNPAADRASAHASEKNGAGSRQVTAILWIAGFVVGIVFIGILSAVPLYAFASMRFRGNCRYLTCIIAAGGATLFIWLLFGVVLRLHLYPGLLLSNA